MSASWDRYLERHEAQRLARNARNRAYHARKKAEREPRVFEAHAYPLPLRLQRILANVKFRCRHRDRYAGRGIRCLITYDDLLFAWNRDSADQMTRPSIDRRENNGDYSPDNIRFIELEINIANGVKVRDAERHLRLTESQERA